MITSVAGQYRIIAPHLAITGTSKKDTLIEKGGNILGSPGVIYPDSAIAKFKEQRQKQRLPYNGIPNALTQKPAPDRYIGNNGKGQDIYQSQLDNMPILKPDSSFYSTMPRRPSLKPATVIPKFPGMTVPGPEWVTPKQYRAPK